MVRAARRPAPARASHRLGFAVKVLGDGGLPSHDTRRWQSGPHLDVSLDRLARIFDYLEQNEIHMYRMSSSLVPYATHPELPQFHGQLDECGDRLAQLGERARRLDLRLSFHPGQYVVLNSESEAVRAAALRDLELHARVLDALGASAEAVVVLHVGSTAGGHRAAAAERFLRSFESLSRAGASAHRDRERRPHATRSPSPRISTRTGLRVVWDVLHHHCHDPAGIGTARRSSWRSRPGLPA